MFFVFSITSIPLMALLGLLSSLVFSKRVVLRRWRKAISWYGKIVIYFLPFPFVRVKYDDLSNRKEKGPFIIICNHRAASDPFLMACLPYEECIQIVNIWPFKIPLIGWGAKMAGYLSVKEMPFENFLQKTTKLIEEKVNIISFPEGTRSNGKEMKQFYSSIFRVAIKNKCSIVPLCISGNEKIPAKGTGILQPGIIKLRRLPALRWEDYKDCSPFILKNRVRDIIKKELEQMDCGI